jgi:hypothetical protein
LKYQEGCQGLNKQKTSHVLGILNRTKKGKGIPTRSLCYKNQATVKTTQKAALSPERTPLKNGTDD